MKVGDTALGRPHRDSCCGENGSTGHRHYTPLVAVDTSVGRIIADTRDHAVGLSTFLHCPYDQDVVEEALGHLDRLLPQGLHIRERIVVEVGANIGTTTLVFVQSCDARRVIALEPSPTVAPLLRATLALNGVTERVSVHKVAAGDRAVPALLETSSVNFGDKLRGAGALLRSGVPVIAEYWPYALQRSGGLETFEAQVRAHFGAIYDVRSRPRGGTLLPSEEVASLRDQYSERLAYTDLDPSS